MPPIPIADSAAVDSTLAPVWSIDTSAIWRTSRKQRQEVEEKLKLDSAIVDLYSSRSHISSGPASDLRANTSNVISTIGPIGSPHLLLEQYNLPGREISINGLPFLYSGIYRPYILGSDLEVLPWEMIQSYGYVSQNLSSNSLAISAQPPFSANTSDIEVARGPYGYQASRWRFFRPFNNRLFAYFSVGFKKSDGYYFNSGYDGYNICAGFRKYLNTGEFTFNYWNHAARGGVNSFDYRILHFSRFERRIDRYEATYQMRLKKMPDPVFRLLFQKNSQLIKGYIDLDRLYQEIGGGEVVLSDTAFQTILLGGKIRYLRNHHFSRSQSSPPVSMTDYSILISTQRGLIGFNSEIDNSYNSIDGYQLLPRIRIEYSTISGFKPFLRFSRERALPDLQLLHFSDTIPDLGQYGGGGTLVSYQFSPSANLKMPITSSYAAGIDFERGLFLSSFTAAYKIIDSQVTLSVNDSANHIFISPYNYDDKFLELGFRGSLRKGIFSSKFSTNYRIWSDDYLPDGAMKGPAFNAFGMISAEKELFIPKLVFGVSLQVYSQSPSDFKSLGINRNEGFTCFSGSTEIRYKDFTFWVNGENLSNKRVSSWYPYYETSRIYWWGFRWNFFD